MEPRRITGFLVQAPVPQWLTVESVRRTEIKNIIHAKGTTQMKQDAHTRHMQHQARAGILPTNSHEILRIDVLKMKTI